MMQERVEVDPVTMMRRVHRFGPELETWRHWYWRYLSTSWRVDETYGEVGGR